jgi:hypothetical protein
VVEEVLELVEDTEVLDDERELDDDGVPELALELLTSKKDETVVVGQGVDDDVVGEHDVEDDVVDEHGVEEVLHIVVFEMEYPSGTKSEVDEAEALEVVWLCTL